MYYTNKNIHAHFVESMEQGKLTNSAIDILIGIGQQINRRYHTPYMLGTKLHGYLELIKHWDRVQLEKEVTLTYMVNIYKRGLQKGSVWARKNKMDWKRMGFISKDDLYKKFGLTDEVFNSVIELKFYGNDFYYFDYNTVYYERWKKMNMISNNDKLKKLIGLVDYCINYEISDKDTFMIILKRESKKNKQRIESYSF